MKYGANLRQKGIRLLEFHILGDLAVTLFYALYRLSLLPTIIVIRPPT